MGKMEDLTPEDPYSAFMSFTLTELGFLSNIAAPAKIFRMP
jgi:hypothetical protein